MEDANGDFLFGQGASNFYINSSNGVAQAIRNALLLFQGEYFADLTAGVPWDTEVLGFSTGAIYDAVLKSAILGVTGVASIVKYSSSLNSAMRVLTVSATVQTLYPGSAVSLVVPLSFVGFGDGGFGDGGFGG